MTFRKLRTRWLALAAAAAAALVVTTAVLAQPPQPEFRFYGLPGDATIDGEVAPIGSTAAASASASTSAATTCMPRSVNARASPSPIPLAAPVTTAVRPSKWSTERS